MVTNIRQVSPLYAAYDANRESIRVAIEQAVAESAAKMGVAAEQLFSLTDGHLTIQELKAA